MKKDTDIFLAEVAMLKDEHGPCPSAASVNGELVSASTVIDVTPTVINQWMARPVVTNSWVNLLPETFQPYGNEYAAKPPQYGYSSHKLKALVQKWPPSKITQKGKSELASTRPLSAEFISALGKGNACNIQELDEEVFRRCVFTGLVEHEASRKLRNEDGYLLNVMNSGDLDFTFNENNRSWECSTTGRQGQGFTSLLQVILNIPYWDAVATLASVVGMDFNKAFSVYDTINAVMENGTHCTQNEIPVSFHVPGMPGGSIAVLEDLIPIHGHAGQITGEIAVYTLNGVTFCLPATVGNGILCIGRYQSPAFLLNQDNIDANPLATVLLCQDMRTAVVLDKLFSGSREITVAKIIVTGHIGYDLSTIPWSYLYERKVVLLCAPEKESLARAKVYEEAIEKAGAASFTIYPYPLLHAEPGEPLEDINLEGFGPCEADLLRNARDLEMEERPFALFRHIQDKSMTPKDFQAWGRSTGLFKPRGGSETSPSPDPVFQGQRVFDSRPQTAADVTLADIFPIGGVTMVHGLKNVGKSLFITELLRAWTSGQNAFSFKGTTPIKCLLFDSETRPEDFGCRLASAGLLPLNDLFLPIVKLDASDDPWASFDMANVAHRKKFETFVRENDVKCIVMDNLTTLTQSGSLSSAITRGSILDWAQQLARGGIAVVLVHHTLKEPQKHPAESAMRWGGEFSIRAHTEIALIGRIQIQADRLGTEKVQDAARKAGATMGIVFKTCKSAHILENRIYWYHRPSGEHEWQHLDTTDFDGNMIEELPESAEGAQKTDIEASSPPVTMPLASESLSGDGDSGNATEEAEDAPALSVDTQKALEFAEKHGGWFTRRDIEELLGCKDSKANKILSELKDRLQSEGKGPSTCYRLRKRSTPEYF